MSFDAELFRKMPPVQYGEWMTDPFTGLQIPKGLGANLSWRKTLVQQAKLSSSTRKALAAASARSPIYWLNAFGWTFLQKRVGEAGHEVTVSGPASHIPFITWKVQDDAIVSLTQAIDQGHDALIHKSRDMGASWLVIAVFQWYFQFRPSTTFLEVSRRENLVDKRGDMDSLFEKHRYMMSRQPEWLRPARLKDNSMFLENQSIGSAILGESTNENAGQASRKTAILLDEFARVREGEEIDLATADTSACRIFNSTPQGPNTHFSRIYKALKTGVRSGKLIMLPWWGHPDKGRGAAIVSIEGKEYVRNQWYETQSKRRSKRNMAQNIDGEHGKSGDSVFDMDEVEKHRAMFQREPLYSGELRYTEDMSEAEIISFIRKGESVWQQKEGATAPITLLRHSSFSPWRFWVPLVNNRPNQQTRYVFGVDISNGSGASNSIISVLDHHSNMIVAKFWDAFTSPEELASIVARAALWFGGIKLPLVIFEKNGPGSVFGRKLLRLGYQNVYYQEILDQKSRVTTKKWGWHSSDVKKQMLLGEYRDALKTNSIINPCKEALDEALDYVFDSNGRIEPASLGVEEGGGSALHGDHVIADALLLFGRKGLPDKEAKIEHVAPKGSFAFRKKQFKLNSRREDEWAR